MTLKHAVYILGIFLIMFVMGCPFSPFCTENCARRTKKCASKSPFNFKSLRFQHVGLWYACCILNCVYSEEIGVGGWGIGNRFMIRFFALGYVILEPPSLYSYLLFTISFPLSPV
jgi:hypothetical protein